MRKTLQQIGRKVKVTERYASVDFVRQFCYPIFAGIEVHELLQVTDFL